MSTITSPADLRKSLIAQGEEQIEASKSELLNQLVMQFAIISKQLDSDQSYEKVASPLLALFAMIINPDTRSGAIEHLNSGSGMIDDGPALQALLNSNSLSGGQKRALERLLVPSHPDHIAVDNTGTPTEMVDLRKDNDTRAKEIESLTSGKTTPEEVQKTVKATLDKIIEPLKALKELANDGWSTVGFFKKTTQEDDDTVRRDLTRKELEKFQSAASEIDTIVTQTA